MKYKHIKEKCVKAEMNGIMNGTMYIKVKSSLLKSYLVDRTKVVLGRMYKLNDGSDQYFKVERLKGVFAWGYKINSKTLKKDCHSLY